jgi:hypothetical protein
MTSDVALNGTGFIYDNLSLKNIRIYLFSFLFVIGNIALPYLCHSIPNGGKIFLPIYFFTLIASYKFGLRTGLLTAVISPFANYFLLGMPPANMLIPVIGNSALIALAASFIASRTGRLSILLIAAVIISQQAAFALISIILGTSYNVIANSIKLAIPGMLLQVFGGYLLLRALKGYGIKNS